MAEFKALAVIFDKLDVTINGRRFTDALDNSVPAEEAKNAKLALEAAAAKINSFNPNVKLSLTFFRPDLTNKTLKYLGLTKYTDPAGKVSDSPILKSEDIEKALKAVDPAFSLKLNEYDTYFIFIPAKDPGLANAGFAMCGWGGYSPVDLKCGAFAFVPSNFKFGNFSGQVFIHEWLHGVCHFYKNLGWDTQISSGDADDGGRFGYADGTGNDLPYYEAMITGKVLDKKQAGHPLAATPGISNTIWNSGTMRSTDIANMIVNAEIKNIYVSEGGFAKLGYPVSTIHKWVKNNTTNYDLELIDFNSTSGTSAIMRVPGITTFRYLPVGWFSKYAGYTGAERLGGPITAPTAWNGGQIVEFKKRDGTKNYMTKSPGNEYGMLTADWYTRYMNAGGPSVLGFPVSDVHSWEAGEIVDFKKTDGTSCALMKPNGSTSIYYLPTIWWNAFLSAGGASGIGYPSSNVTTDTGVEYMTFKTTGGSVSALVRQMGSNSVYHLPADWYTAYKKAGGPAVMGYPYNNGKHGWGDGEIIDFKLSSGKESALMKPNYGRGNGIIQYLPNLVWEKYKSVGGATSIGYPYSDWHAWGTGMIMDFAPKSGYDSAIMQETGSAKLHHVKGLIWLAFKNTADATGSGAKSYLGYPRSDEYSWKDSKSGKEFYRSDFKGGWCWASKTDSSKYGNDKNFKA